VNLNLDNARLSREIEDRIKAELRRLPATEQKFVLERVAVDVLAGLSGPNGSSAASRPTTPQASSGTSADALATATTSTHWEAIVAYCRAHDPDGSFHNTDLAKALFPEKMKKNRNVAISTIYTATKRRSVDDSSDPYFVLLKKGRFRLATAEERAKAKEKREG
jgi:hypothetical protein